MLLRVEFARSVVNDGARYSSVYSLAWLVVVGVICAVLGGGLGHLVARVRSKAAARIQELEAELESARTENSGYRREVFDQFAETARKFKNLDESYNDLHRQLAASASLLCGEAAGPLLDAPAPQAALPPEERAEGPAEGPAEEPGQRDQQDEAAVASRADASAPAVSEPEGAETAVEQAADADEEVPILVAEVDGEPAQAEPSEAEDSEPQPRRAEDAA